jgi:hypothetical protein
MAQNNLLSFLADIFAPATSSSYDIQVVNAPSAVEVAGQQQQTGVARYLSDLPLITGVTKYLKKQPEMVATGVAKYVAKQSLLTPEEAPILTGVAKYVAKTTPTAPAASGVAKYLAAQMLLNKNKPVLSSVARYINKQEKVMGNAVLLSGVAKYQAEQDLMAKKAAATAMIAKYLKEEALAAQTKAEAELKKAQEELLAPTIEEPAATGVGRFMQTQAKLAQATPPVSGVAKYLARQLIIESQKPALTGVAKYMSKQPQPAIKAKPAVSSVARYLEAQALASRGKPAFSGVSKYLLRQSLVEKNKPPMSSVSKYVAAHSAIEKIQPKETITAAPSTETLFERVAKSGVAQYLERQAQLALEALAAAEKSLVGEYIPAHETEAGADACKVIQEEQEAVVSIKETATGVAKYIEKQIQAAALLKLTSVDRYLLQRA